jgi:hypothetical protein
VRDDNGGTDRRAADHVGRGHLGVSGFRSTDRDPVDLAVLLADADLHRADLLGHAKPVGVERLAGGVPDSIDERCVADDIGHDVFISVHIGIADVIGISDSDGLADRLALRYSDADRLRVW